MRKYRIRHHFRLLNKPIVFFFDAFRLKTFRHIQFLQCAPRGISSAMRGPSTINTPSFSRSRLFFLQTKQFFYLYIRCTCNHFLTCIFYLFFMSNFSRISLEPITINISFSRSGSCGLIATSIFPFLIIPTTLIPRRSLTPRSTRLFPTPVFAARRSLPYCNHLKERSSPQNSFDTRLFTTRLPISISGYTIRSAPTLCRIAP